MYSRLAYSSWGALLWVAACGSTGEVSSGSEFMPADLDAGDATTEAKDLDASVAIDASDAARDAARVVDASQVDTCKDGVPRGVPSSGRRAVRSFMPSAAGVTVCANGTTYVSAASSTQLYRVDLSSGQAESFFVQNSGLFAGLGCDDRGRVFVADQGYLGAGALVQIALKNSGKALDNPQDFTTASYRDVLAVKDVGVYASDTGAGRIVYWRENGASFSVSVATTEAPGVHGLARGTDGRVYAALTNTFPGADSEVVSYAVAPDGTLTDRQNAWKGPHLLDGIAIDENNDLYLAFDAEGLIVRARDNATVAMSTHPTNLAFRGGTLLWTDFDEDAARLDKVTGNATSSGYLYAVDLGVCGAR